jgi:tetratricopeptide (TPR) repeat protein
MNNFKYVILVSPLCLMSCVTTSEKTTLASLRDVTIEIKEERIEGSLEKAMESYQKFLQETPESAMTPEAIRRLADLKIEKEYDSFSKSSPATNASSLPAGESASVAQGTAATAALVSSDSEDKSRKLTDSEKQKKIKSSEDVIANVANESVKEFEKRTTKKDKIKASKEKPQVADAAAAEELQTVGAMEAIELYKGLLIKYPLYERNDQVLYQLSRAYEEVGMIEEAQKVLNKLVAGYPESRHIDEAQFRRAEYFFTRKRYLDSEEAYQAVINIGIGSAFYELALYKQGWTFFKQDMYEEALNDFIALLDFKISIGFDFDNIESKIEKKRIEDTYRVVSLSFSYLGGAKFIAPFFEKLGPRSYEASIYSHLGEYYLDKRRYADAALSYNTFVERNPINKVSPYFNIRVIEIYLKGGFPKLVVDSKKNYANTYGLRATYWSYFDINEYPEVLSYLKSNLVDLANHYHALYQNKRLRKFRVDNYNEATNWYREFLESFPEDELAAGMNFQLAELMLENKDFRSAALEYERTSYNYLTHEKSSDAGYAAVFAYREYLKKASQAERSIVKREIIRSSLKFVDVYPGHKNAAIVLAAAADDIYAIKDFDLAVKTGRKVLKDYPSADKKLHRSAWLIVAHASFDLTVYRDAEEAYSQVLSLTGKKHKDRKKLVENLAASIYKQGEQARKLDDHRTAADHFLRVASVTPTSKIRSTAEYDAAASLITLKDWPKAAEVLEAFRKRYRNHKLQPEVTKKLAVIYKEDKKYLLAAAEFERIETESKDSDLRREALLQAAELYEKADDINKALLVYNRFVRLFPKPLEFVLETRNKIANIYKSKNDNKKYKKQLRIIVKADKNAGKERTDRTMFLAANASLTLTEPYLSRFVNVKLVIPFKKNLNEKKKRMKKAIAAYTRLIDYEVGVVTAAATYHIAEIYFHFSRALMDSERPKKLSELELEQYNLVIEEQAFPFEEKAIKVHEKNMELLDRGIYNEWIDNSLIRLSTLLPARYAKPEEASEFVEFLVPKDGSPIVGKKISNFISKKTPDNKVALYE